VKQFAVGKGSLIVLGHSLGSTLATYLTFDLAHPGKLGPRVRGCFYASPRPGDAVPSPRPSVNALTLTVAAETTIEQSVVTLLQNLTAQLEAAIDAGDMTAIQAAATQITANTAALSAAVLANTTAAPPSAAALAPVGDTNPIAPAAVDTSAKV
jgi:pimeloyl-ACP methyl ester carboxylesterase